MIEFTKITLVTVIKYGNNCNAQGKGKKDICAFFSNIYPTNYDISS